jgi:hypothetical protein
MGTDAGGVGGAYDATVRTGAAAEPAERMRMEAEVVTAEDALARIDEKMVGWRQAHADAKAAVEDARERLRRAGG